jgi:hypothetical protein
MIKSIKFSLINYDCLPFQYKIIFSNVTDHAKMLPISNRPSPPTNRGPLAPLWLVVVPNAHPGLSCVKWSPPLETFGLIVRANNYFGLQNGSIS